MTQEEIGGYTINWEPLLELATVTVQGFLVREVVYHADGPSAFEKCKAWAEAQNGGKK